MDAAAPLLIASFIIPAGSRLGACSSPSRSASINAFRRPLAPVPGGRWTTGRGGWGLRRS
ncbi:hypothetical protein PVAP13_3KG126755 [Panicum virgatum]|uniref:Uncharacterized protein n=1 Tax=Panicum virgatum TaxID=38727 RepID=A0A8T0USZ2_PANVG|nr:hypothetical protein PVAP13_3KG126755 [Panicum virgatum]